MVEGARYLTWLDIPGPRNTQGAYAEKTSGVHMALCAALELEARTGEQGLLAAGDLGGLFICVCV